MALNLKYKDIFFDLDRTLWDFDRNSAETLHELYDDHGLKNELGVDVDSFISKFREINAAEWRDFRNGGQTKEEMRNNRFVQTFFHYGSGDWKLARKLSREYIEICPYKSNLISGARDLLENLKSDYSMHIITNGFSDTQKIKIESSDIRQYFNAIIISDETPYRKPQREIFLEGVKKANAEFEQSIMIGDDWQKDIQGAKRAGMDQIFFNPDKKGVDEAGSCTFEIDDILMVEKIVRNSG